MVFGSFSSSSFICLGVTLVLIGILGYLISKKFQDQNHKISSMCELVTTMAQDLQMLKMQNAVDKIQHSLNNSSSSSSSSSSNNDYGLISSSTSPSAKQKDTIVVGGLAYCSIPSSAECENKIVVSDDDYTLDGSEESSLQDYEDNDDDEEDVDISSDDEIEITEITRQNEYESDDTSVVNIDIDDNSHTKHIELVLENTNHKEQEEVHLPQIVVNKLETVTEPELYAKVDMDMGVAVAVAEVEEVEMDILEMSDLSTTEIKETSNQQSNKPKKSKNSRTNSLEDSEVSGNDISEDFSGDYSKLNVTQLRKLVTVRGLSSHATKLKKMELLQLLGGTVSIGIEELN